MPLYEYQCDACAHRFEVIQKFSDPLVEVCPKCGGAVTKLLSSPAIQFKGSGWYITDYAKKSGAAAGGAKGESAPASGEAKGDQKTSSESSTAAPATPAPAASSTKTP